MTVKGLVRRATGWDGLPPSRLSGSARVWVLAALQGALALGLYLAFIRGLQPVDAPFQIPWWGMALLFYLGEVPAIDVQIRRNAFAFSLSEVPIVIGLFLATPGSILAGQMVGSLAVLMIHRRQGPLKLALNLTQFVLGTSLAILVTHGVGIGDPLRWVSWVAVLLAMLVVYLVGHLSVSLAISLTEGQMRLQTFLEDLWFGKLVAITNGSLGLLAVLVLWQEPSAGWLLIIPLVMVFVAYRAYTSEREKHDRMDSLYRTARALQRTSRFGETVRLLLEQTREMFRAEIAEIVLLDGESGQGTRARLSSEGEFREGEPVVMDPTEGVWARVLSEDRGILLAKPIGNERLREHFEAQGMRDVMVAPLRGESGAAGVFRVANRMGDISTFDREDLQLFETLVSHASAALENARLVDRLRESLERLTESNKVKDDFVATVSHELRTPLTVMRGFIKTLMRDDVSFDVDQQRGFLEAADRGGERLHELIEQLLTVSRIEAERETLAMAPVPLPAIVEHAVAELSAGRASHRMDIEGTRGLPTVVTDGAKIRQILSNLLENAIKYSPTGSKVTVSGEVSAGTVTLRVRDEGEGIPHEHQDRIFDRFYQVDSSTTRHVGGTGLGLYICRRLADQIGADLRLDRSGPEGSVFSLSIPRTGSEGRPDLQVVSTA